MERKGITWLIALALILGELKGVLSDLFVLINVSCVYK